MPSTTHPSNAAEIQLCKLDRAHWISNHFTIKDKAGALRLLNPMSVPQAKLAALIAWQRERERPVRIIVLKARKTGISTLVEADMLCEVIARGIDALVIAHDKDTSEYIFEITHRFYQHYDLPKPELARANKGEIKFEGREGFVKVETANNIHAGTGLTPQYIHASEYSKWEHGTQTATALLQSVGDNPGTTILIESTAFGFDDLFYPTWQRAHENCRVTWSTAINAVGQQVWVPEVDVTNPRDWNGYLPYFIAWHDDPSYCRVFDSPAESQQFAQTLNELETHLHTYYNCTLEQLNWRRWTLKEKCRGDAKVLAQEWPGTPREAFVASGRPRLDHEALDLMSEEPGRRGYLRQSETWTRQIGFLPDKGGDLVIFRDPVKGHRYVIGVDVAEGLSAEGTDKSDASAVCVIDIDNGGEQVAVYGGNHLSEEDIVQPVKALAVYYNEAYVVIETNSTGKHTAIELSKIYRQDRMYHRTDWDEGRAKRSRILGWRTHIGTRPILIASLARAIQDRAVMLHDRTTIHECRRLVVTPGGRVEADKGEHDDWPFALGLAIVGMQSYPPSGEPAPMDLAPPWLQRVYRPDSRSSGDKDTGY